MLSGQQRRRKAGFRICFQRSFAPADLVRRFITFVSVPWCSTQRAFALLPSICLLPFASSRFASAFTSTRTSPVQSPTSSVRARDPSTSHSQPESSALQVLIGCCLCSAALVHWRICVARLFYPTTPPFGRLNSAADLTSFTLRPLTLRITETLSNTPARPQTSAETAPSSCRFATNLEATPPCAAIEFRIVLFLRRKMYTRSKSSSNASANAILHPGNQENIALRESQRGRLPDATLSTV